MTEEWAGYLLIYLNVQRFHRSALVWVMAVYNSQELLYHPVFLQINPSSLNHFYGRNLRHECLRLYLKRCVFHFQKTAQPANTHSFCQKLTWLSPKTLRWANVLEPHAKISLTNHGYGLFYALYLRCGPSLIPEKLTQTLPFTHTVFCCSRLTASQPQCLGQDGHVITRAFGNSRRINMDLPQRQVTNNNTAYQVQ